MTNTDFSSVKLSGSRVISNLCSGSTVCLVILFMGLFTFLYSVSWTDSQRSKWFLRRFFSLQISSRGQLPVWYLNWKKFPIGFGGLSKQRLEVRTYCRVFGHNLAAFCLKSWPRIYRFHRLTACLWSLVDLNSEESSL